MSDTTDDFDPHSDFDTRDDHVGFFIVPAEHLDELHALEAAAYEAQLRCYEKRPPRPGWMHYRENQLFERAREVATAAVVIEDGEYVNDHDLVSSWVLGRFGQRNWRRKVLNPDELAAMARELPGIRTEDVLQWGRDNQWLTRGREQRFVELFEALVRMVAEVAPAAAGDDFPFGLAMLELHTKFRHPPDLPPPEPNPPRPPADLDEGALMGWFTVPAAHIPALQAIEAARDAAFRHERWDDFYALETRLFDRARAVARNADVFDAWAYKPAYSAWAWTLGMPAIRDAELREYWAYRLTREGPIPDLPGMLGSPGADTSAQDRARVRELSEALRRAADPHLAQGCGLVIAWRFEKAPTWPRFDHVSRRAAWMRIHELIAQRDQAKAALRAIETKQRRARTRANHAAEPAGQGPAPGATPDAGPGVTPDPGEIDAGEIDTIDAIDAQVLGQAMAQASVELAQRFPWLCRLPDHEQVLAWLARRIAGPRVAGAAPARRPIVLTALLAEDFFHGDTRVERAGRQAMAAALAQRPAWIELVLPRRGKPDVRVVLDGHRLRVEDQGLSADACFARAPGRSALLDVQAAWHQGVIDECNQALGHLLNTYPQESVMLVQERLEKMTSDSVMRRLDRDNKREARRARAQQRKQREAGQAHTKQR